MSQVLVPGQPPKFSYVPHDTGAAFPLPLVEQNGANVALHAMGGLSKLELFTAMLSCGDGGSFATHPDTKAKWARETVEAAAALIQACADYHKSPTIENGATEG